MVDEFFYEARNPVIRLALGLSCAEGDLYPHYIFYQHHHYPSSFEMLHVTHEPPELEAGLHSLTNGIQKVILRVKGIHRLGAVLFLNNLESSQVPAYSQLRKMAIRLRMHNDNHWAIARASIGSLP